MPTINLNRKVIESILGRHFEDDYLKDRISYLGTDLEKVDENEIIVEIFPNRPDMLSEYGFARAMSSFLKIKKGLSKYNVLQSNEKVVVHKEVAKVRPYTVCAIVKNLHLDDEKIKEIIQIQEKLHITFCRNRKKAAIGIYPLEKIKFPIAYTAKKPQQIIFQPLDSAREMDANEIIAEHPAGKEYGHLLKGADVYPVFIDANDDVLSVPPIINSEKTGRVTEHTNEFFIECSGFDLSTLQLLLNMLVSSFADMGGHIYSMKVEYPKEKYPMESITTPNLEPREMKIDYGYINKLLGLSLSDEEIHACLEMMGYGIKTGTANAGIALVPGYRADILHTVDLAEDVAIAYGYENFEPEIPKVATIANENKLEKFSKNICSMLVGLGFQEVNTYHLTNRKSQCGKMNCDIGVIELANALTEDFNALRAWIIPNILDVLATNKTREFPQKIFDIGAIFKKSADTETGILEHIRLAAATSNAKADFAESKSVLDNIFRMLSMEYELVQDDHPSFIPGRVGRVICNGKKVGYLGEIHPKVLENFNIEMPVSCFEINLSEIFSLLFGEAKS